MGKVWVNLKVGWGRASGNHQGGANSVSQVDAVSKKVSPAGSEALLEAGLRKGTVASASTFVWEKATSQLLP